MDWTHYDVDVPGANGQFYPPVVDPYDPQHLLMSGHGVPVLAESTAGGDMERRGARPTHDERRDGRDQLHRHGERLADAFGLAVDRAGHRRTSGTCARHVRTGANGWQQVETNEHPGGISQIYQPGASGVVYMAGLYSSSGYGVLRSTDYGMTWTHVGATTLLERVVFGTPNNVYAMMGDEISGTGSDPALQLAPQPGTGWTMPPTPPGMTQGPLQVTVTSDGTHSIVLLASWTAGIYRYVEP